MKEKNFVTIINFGLINEYMTICRSSKLIGHHEKTDNFSFAPGFFFIVATNS